MKTLRAFRLSDEVIAVLNKQPNATQYIEDLVLGKAEVPNIKKSLETKPRPPEFATPHFVPKPPDPETGYPCCVKRTPCKHWTWNSERELWVNVLTGLTKESA